MSKTMHSMAQSSNRPIFVSNQWYKVRYKETGARWANNISSSTLVEAASSTDAIEKAKEKLAANGHKGGLTVETVEKL